MKFDTDDTIVAIASAGGHAIRGIVRVSGNDTIALLGGLAIETVDTEIDFRVWLGSLKRPRFVCCNLELNPGCAVEVRLLVWPGDHSFTRQPSAEFHTFGSPAILQMVLERLIASGCRIAEPGEFTMRAFLSGRIDLTQAEAVLGVIDATSEAQFSQALSQLAGGLGGPVQQVRDDLLDLLAELEAGLDFAEEDIEFISAVEMQDRLEHSRCLMQQLQNQIADRQSASDLPVVVLCGRPNAGKSSLFNSLVGGEAIVSSIAGTTRDVLKARVAIDGLEIELVDTAGLDELACSATPDTVAQQMQRQSQSQIDNADLLVFCFGADQMPEVSVLPFPDFSEHPRIVAITKSDLALAWKCNLQDTIVTSTVNGTGLQELKVRIVEDLHAVRQREFATTTIARTSGSIVAAAHAIENALAASQSGLGEEIVAAEIRVALEELACVVGATYTDDILDLVFGRFCIGK